jgi:DNA-binding transcriptional MocR family regulator
VAPTPPISFARGAPSPECLAPDLIAGCARAVLERDGLTVLSYGAGGGYAPLRQLLAERHGVDPARVFVTSGGLQGFALFIAEQLRRRPGRVLVEGPTYDRPLKLLGWQGVDVVSLPMDGEGLELDALEAELGRGGDVSFLYTIPTFQNPSGRTLGVERRRRLAEIVRAHGLDVLEDDPYGLVRYEGERPPSLHELEGGEWVSFTSSFSKTVAPGLRVGYFVVTEGLRAAYDERAVSTYITPPLLPEAIVHEVHASGVFEPNLDRIRGLLRLRRDTMLDALASEMPEGVTWNRPEGGYFLWVELGGRDAGEVQRRAAEAGVMFVPGSDFFPAGDDRGASAARFAFSFETPERIREGVAILASVL